MLANSAVVSVICQTNLDDFTFVSGHWLSGGIKFVVTVLCQTILSIAYFDMMVKSIHYFLNLGRSFCFWSNVFLFYYRPELM